MQMTVKDAAQALNVAEKTVYRWIQTGGLPAYRVAGQYRINRAMLFEWATSKRINFSAADLVFAPHLCPVRIAAGALGNGLPEADMVVSPQHRMLVGGVTCELLFGESEALAAAVHLVGKPGITRLAPRAISYLHVMCDVHEIILADGAWSESFQPGDTTIDGMDDASRVELFEVFPELREASSRKTYGAARLSLKAHEVRVLMSA